ncbi:proteobacterial dedicated sortase system response regulator [Thiosocius teredinicola]|uniref:proteobacterial dedicated sortase system response regulator n=1 Tax=Thiosocius teredinicola TaxID=1973002 RepID=UPI000990CBF0
MARTIAIVEDEPAIRENYADLFRRQGYRVETFAERATAAEALSRRLPDLAILDIGLGDEFDGGFELCRRLRSLSATLPIIFLTARDSDIDVVAGLRVGADDYVTKDVSLHQLTARVSALFRRIDAQHEQSHSEGVIEEGALRLQAEQMRVTWRDQAVELTVTELWILHALVRNPGHVKSREQLMEAADTYVDLATITSHIKRIRKKFQRVDPDFDAIEAVYGAGYRWLTQD